MKTARVLLVDDNQDNLDLLSVLLSEHYVVSSYASAAEALRELDTVKPDVLVLDIGMAPIDGMECLQAIRARPGHARTPAVALTAFAREVERKTFIAAGFQAVVTKPIFDPREVVTVIDRMLGQPRQERIGDEPTVSVAS